MPTARRVGRRHAGAGHVLPTAEDSRILTVLETAREEDLPDICIPTAWDDTIGLESVTMTFHVSRRTRSRIVQFGLERLFNRPEEWALERASMDTKALDEAVEPVIGVPGTSTSGQMATIAM
ncbi:MAG: hypothetical protein M1823_003231, partial [Watsoniomyces obsoletus]